jgi:uncharacterized protein YjiS (DUF1127 family)
MQPSGVPKKVPQIDPPATESNAMSTLALEILSPHKTRTLIGRIQAAYSALRDRKERRATTLALSRMNDHFLRDIGVTRFEIKAEPYGLLNERRFGRERDTG